MNRDWSARCLFGWHAWVKMDVIVWPRELANPLEDVWILLHDHFFACYKLESLLCNCWCICVGFSCVFFWVATCFFWICRTSFVFFGWSAELVIKLALSAGGSLVWPWVE